MYRFNIDAQNFKEKALSQTTVSDIMKLVHSYVSERCYEHSEKAFNLTNPLGAS